MGCVVRRSLPARTFALFLWGCKMEHALKYFFLEICLDKLRLFSSFACSRGEITRIYSRLSCEIYPQATSSKQACEWADPSKNRNRILCKSLHTLCMQ